MRQYVLSREAQISLQDIRGYSFEKFGKQQTIVYLRRLRDRMRYLAENPKSGQSRDELNVGYYSYFEGSHTIYYRIRPDHVDIIDVLHQSMEPLRHLTK